MKTKKDKRKNLERYKSVFFQSGLIISLAIVFFAFEWKSYNEIQNNLGNPTPVIIDEELPPVIQEEKKEIKPETIELEIVEDDKKVKNDVDVDVEDNQKKKVTKYIPIKDDPDPIIIDEKPIYQIVEEMPVFPGGEEDMFRYLSSNISYPVMAKESNIQGTVHLTFVVETDGNISNVRILRGIGGGCDEEAVRVVQDMPQWTPGSQQGRPVRVQFNLPVKFILR